jgi:Tfp pilus assembly protein PilW
VFVSIKYKNCQSGYMLAELLVAIPLMLIMLTVIHQVLGVCLAMWQDGSIRIELQQNVRFAADSIVRDVQYAKSITITGGNKLDVITEKYGASAQRITYSYDKAVQPYAIRRNKNDGSGAQPVIGGNKKSPVTVSVCQFTPLVKNAAGDPRTVNIIITALNTTTGQHFTIETAVTANLVAP